MPPVLLTSNGFAAARQAKQVQKILASFRGTWVVNLDCLFNKGMSILNAGITKHDYVGKEEERDLEEYVGFARDDITYLLTNVCNGKGGALVDVDFKPGKLGVDFDPHQQHTIRSVQPGTQAYVKGVEQGWEVVQIDGRPASLDHLKSMTTGSQDYRVTFRTVDCGILLYGSGKGYGPFTLDDIDRVLYVMQMILQGGGSNRIMTWLMAENPKAPPGMFMELPRMGRHKCKGIFVCGGEPHPAMQVAVQQFCAAFPDALYAGRSAGSILAGSAIHCTRGGLVGEGGQGLVPSLVIVHDPGSNEAEQRHIAKMKSWAEEQGRPTLVLPDGEVFYDGGR